MNWKFVLSLLLVFMLMFSLFAGCTQQKKDPVEDVRQQLEALPTVEEFQAMDEDAQLDAYNRTQKAYDDYMALTEEQKQQLPEAEKTFEALFAYFNSQIMPLPDWD